MDQTLANMLAVCLIRLHEVRIQYIHSYEGNDVAATAGPNALAGLIPAPVQKTAIILPRNSDSPMTKGAMKVDFVF